MWNTFSIWAAAKIQLKAYFEFQLPAYFAGTKGVSCISHAGEEGRCGERGRGRNTISYINYIFSYILYKLYLYNYIFI